MRLAFGAVASQLGRSLLHRTPRRCVRMKVYNRGGAGRRMLLFDGGTGEELFRRGVEQDREIWSAVAVVNETYHPALIDVHRAFIEAGCDILTMNNFGVTPGVGFSVPDVLKYARVAAELANRARETSEAPQVQVACSLPPLVESYRPDLVMQDRERGTQIYRDLALAVQDQVDVYLAETLSSIDEMTMALGAVLGLGKPVYASWTLGSDGRLRSGETVTEAIQQLLKFSGDSEILRGVMFNCCEPEAITQAFDELGAPGNPAAELLQTRRIGLGACPNRLTPVDPNWTIADNPEPQPFRDDMSQDTYVGDWVRQWVAKSPATMILGGCCGLGPEYIAAMNRYRSSV